MGRTAQTTSLTICSNLEEPDVRDVRVWKAAQHVQNPDELVRMTNAKHELPVLR